MKIIEPFVEIESDELSPSKVELLNGDCLELMKNLPDKSIDLILCDLPYGVTANKKDIALPFEPLWTEYERIIKTNGAIVLFGQGTFYVDLVDSNRKLFRYDLIWDKVYTTGFLNAKRMPLRCHEQIAVFYKKLPTYNPQFTKGKFNHSRGSKSSDLFNNQNYGKYGNCEVVKTTDKYPTSIIRVPKSVPSKAVHPTEKPVKLLEWLVKTYTNEDEIVLDNCMGSGSTGVACVNTRRNFIGMELDKEYFEIAKKRIEEAKCLYADN